MYSIRLALNSQVNVKHRAYRDRNALLAMPVRSIYQQQLGGTECFTTTNCCGSGSIDARRADLSRKEYEHSVQAEPSLQRAR